MAGTEPGHHCVRLFPGRDARGNLYFRFPETFDGLLALSGIYTSEYGFPGYMDELVYANSPVDYLAGISPDNRLLACTTTTRRWLSSGRARGKCRRAHSHLCAEGHSRLVRHLGLRCEAPGLVVSASGLSCPAHFMRTPEALPLDSGIRPVSFALHPRRVSTLSTPISRLSW